ncbi:hypothetical protein OGH69_16135 [Flavobacterium sp. MFBS3-15]|uniref:hypothetical protein n=1 Tax=Flavobacterium sp. MFBS3-15 TaxID=2989816 RepID=UPI002235FEB9|nr:hypothetical protein [Flavobacterium sp. MFBS3-15]MCW4470501.1 hypothetical protein [Flavobacterium sp. MFBS3-15]
MKKPYALKILLILLPFIALTSCGEDEDYKRVSPVQLDLNAVPYPKLSDYKFFEGEMKNQDPAYKVLPYDLNSALFTDYAHKKRFIWMPEGVNATYISDSETLNFPVGTVLIKTFYYDNVQPSNTTRIIETRLLIKKGDAWIFANYIWNDDQTEAVLNTDGSYTNVSWTENGITKSADYRIPSQSECLTCHKTNDSPVPIGPKPQNLNKNFSYPEGQQDQLSRWVEEGYLDDKPNGVVSTVDWTDTSKPLDLRVRSYIDINCAHCHKENSHCDYMSMRFAFSETGSPENLGICVPPQDNINPSLSYIVAKRNTLRSALAYRIKSVNPNERMPLLGRSIVHEEAVAMITEWINSMDSPCP